MSGHSKWSKVKHQKATTDVMKAKAFTKASRGLFMAVREGSGITDPEKNFRLRLAIEKARQVNMPKDTIERAIAKAKGEGSASLEEIVYEAYGPFKVGMLIYTATDNRQRTVSEIKNILERNGGVLASPGSVGFQFQKIGVITVSKKEGVSLATMMDVAIESGADDVILDHDAFIFLTPAHDVLTVQSYLQKNGIQIIATEVSMKPIMEVPVKSDQMAPIQHLVEAIEALDDVEDVYTNASPSEK